jgi:hypothetical protein
MAACALLLACARPPERGPDAEIEWAIDGALSLTAGSDAEAPFFPDSDLDPDLPAPTEHLGFALGDRLASSAATVALFEAWAETSPRVRVERYATSHEGRPLVRAIISSPANLERLDSIRSDLGKLADPRGVSATEIETVIANSPAVGWLGYSIHGDEVSGVDASLAVGHLLVAGRSQEVTALLDRIVVVIDPVMNPDGRERIRTMIEQASGATPNLDDRSLHRGRWPWGRGNHYLFDLNRDWIAGRAPETRGRWKAMLDLPPQLVVDAHEMGAQDTYLFYPQSPPLNPSLPKSLARWHQAFAADHARAFDRHGWSYYTREWADGFYPGYSDAWASLTGAIGILYEQSSTKGLSVRRRSGIVRSYRQSVHGHAVASVANLMTLANHREEILRDYAEARQDAIDVGRDAFVIIPGRHPDRERELIVTMMRQGIEVHRSDEAFTARAHDTLARRRPLDVPAGAYVIWAAQPQGRLLRELLDLDPRVDDETLQKEREDLEREEGSRLYDVTAWDLAHAYGVEGGWIRAPKRPTTALTQLPSPPTLTAPDPNAVAWAVDARDDASLRFAAAAMRNGIAVHVARKPLRFAGQALPRGSLIIRRQENTADVAERIALAARDAGTPVLSSGTSRSPDEGPDLGGHEFELLERPRVAIISNSPISPSDFGHTWHELDRQLGISASFLDAQSLGQYDLRRYNVIVLPPAWGLQGLLKRHGGALASWAKAGGTLVALGGAASALANDDRFGGLRTRADAIEDLDDYQRQVERERDAREVTVDPKEVWTRPRRGESSDPDDPPTMDRPDDRDEDEDDPSDPDARRDDEWRERFMPSGAIARGLLDDRHWLTSGIDAEELAVFVGDDAVLWSDDGLDTAVRLANAKRVAIAGLLWPEARQRLGGGAYLTREGLGRGQVIAFATTPLMRGYWRATARLFGNAIVLGPGLGASAPTIP